MWAFPRSKPQLFAQSPLALAAGIADYSFGWRVPLAVHTAVALQPLVPGCRRAMMTRVDSFELASSADAFEPVCGWERWLRLEAILLQQEPMICEWVFRRSQWDKRRSSALGLGRAARPYVFLTVEAANAAALQPMGRPRTFRVPTVRSRLVDGPWQLTSLEPMPAFHRTPMWTPRRIGSVAAEASSLLLDQLQRPQGVPRHWQPMHGDFVPWNLREARDGTLWLLDWEDAAWGPPSADLVRYAVAYHSIHERRAEHILRAVRGTLDWLGPADITEAASFWTRHHNVQRPHEPAPTDKSQRKDAARLYAESQAFRLLAGGT
jgi:Phosphotransferase enzyme family